MAIGSRMLMKYNALPAYYISPRAINMTPQNQTYSSLFCQPNHITIKNAIFPCSLLPATWGRGDRDGRRWLVSSSQIWTIIRALDLHGAEFSACVQNIAISVQCHVLCVPVFQCSSVPVFQSTLNILHWTMV